jgi:hypothetical protein
LPESFRGGCSFGAGIKADLSRRGGGEQIGRKRKSVNAAAASSTGDISQLRERAVPQRAYSCVKLSILCQKTASGCHNHGIGKLDASPPRRNRQRSTRSSSTPSRASSAIGFSRLAKNGIRLTSITQDLGDDPMSVMLRYVPAGAGAKPEYTKFGPGNQRYNH